MTSSRHKTSDPWIFSHPDTSLTVSERSDVKSWPHDWKSNPSVNSEDYDTPITGVAGLHGPPELLGPVKLSPFPPSYGWPCVIMPQMKGRDVGTTCSSTRCSPASLGRPAPVMVEGPVFWPEAAALWGHVRSGPDLETNTLRNMHTLSRGGKLNAKFLTR